MRQEMVMAWILASPEPRVPESNRLNLTLGTALSRGEVLQVCA